MPVKLGVYAGSYMVQEINPASIPVMRLVASGGTNPYAGMLAGFDASGDMEPIDPGTLSGSGISELTGEVTAGPGSGSQAATIANSAVTYAKIQNVSATDKLLGRSTSGAGVVEEIACTAAGRNLLDDADNTAQRTTLGLGTMATQSASAVAITGGTIATLTSLGVTDITATGVTSVGFFRTPITTAASIATGAIALGSGNATGMNLRLETEGLAASDDLDSITGGQDGWWLCISTNNSARDVTIKNSVATDKFQLVGGLDFILTTATSRLYVMRISGVWREMFRVIL